MRTHTPILLIALALVAGCKKHYPLVADTNWVRTEAFGNEPPSEFYVYDAMGRLISDSFNGDVKRYTYNQDTITCNNFLNSQQYITNKYYLNARGLVYFDGQQYYYYDSLGENIESIYGADTEIFVWSHGDIVKEWAAGATDTGTFSYFDIPDNRNFGQQYFGRSAYHLIKSNSLSESYSYSFDGLGRVSTLTVNDGSGILNTTTYTYY